MRKSKGWETPSLLLARMPLSLSSKKSLHDIIDRYDFNAGNAARRADVHRIALARFHEGAAYGGEPVDLSLVHVGFIDADQLDRDFLLVVAGIGDGRAEEDLLQPLLAARIDNFRALGALGEIADAAVDFTQALLVVKIIAVFRTVAVSGGP